jgi:MFS family permease
VTCLIILTLAERFGRKRTLAALLALMAIGLPLVFLLAFKANNVAGLLLLPLAREAKGTLAPD